MVLSQVIGLLIFYGIFSEVLGMIPSLYRILIRDILSIYIVARLGSEGTMTLPNILDAFVPLSEVIIKLTGPS